MFIKDIKVGEKVEGFYSVKYSRIVKRYANGYMFEAGLSDKTGELALKYWGGNDESAVKKVHDVCRDGEVVFVSGICDKFKDKLQVSVNEGKGTLRKAESQEYTLDMFLPMTNQDMDAMFNFILDNVKGFRDEYLKRLVLSFLEDKDFVMDFKKCPAAMYYHHACIGGLLEHVWGMMRIANEFCKIHPSLDKDLVLSGIFLHDIGKLREYQVTTNIKVSPVGMLRGHISIGEEMVMEKIKNIPNFPHETAMKLLHIIVSHHGEKEHGAMKEPQFPEAAAVYLIDLLDSSVTQYIRLKKDTTSEDFRIYVPSLKRELYLK